MWVLLQNVAFLLDKKQETCVAIYKSLEVLLPCIHCRNSYTEFFKDFSDPTAGNYAEWVYRMHKRVNFKLNNQQIEKALSQVTSVFFRGSIRTFLEKTREILFKEPTFEVVQKRFEMNYEDPVPRRDLMIVLLALATNYDKAIHKEPLLKWLQCIYDVLPKAEILVVMQAIVSDKNVLDTVIQLKYGSLNEDSRFAASLIKAGSCLKNTCT